MTKIIIASSLLRPSEGLIEFDLPFKIDSKDTISNESGLNLSSLALHSSGSWRQFSLGETPWTIDGQSGLRMIDITRFGF